jgi:hypothetical protein
MPGLWIQKAIKRKSSLRKSLHIPEGQKIPEGTLKQIKEKQVGSHIQSHGRSVPVTRTLKKRGTLATTLRRLQKKVKR